MARQRSTKSSAPRAAARRKNGADTVRRETAKPHLFSELASQTAHYAGKPLTFLVAVLVVVVWAVTGPLFGYSDTWQLVINTSTTIVTS